MQALLSNLVANSFIPHGHCYLWQPELVSLHVVSDTLTALAYYSIPATLIYVVQKRRDLPFNWIFIMFAGFIVFCGTSHLMEVWTLWYPTYWVSGIVKAITAVISVVTAFQLVPLLPKVLSLPSLEALNRSLQREIADRTQAEAQLSDVKNQLAKQLADMTQLHFLGSRLSTTLELEPLLDEMVAAVTSLLGSNQGVLMLYARDSDDLYPVASVGFTPEYLQGVGRIKRGVGACGTVLERRHPVVIEDVKTDPIFAPYCQFASLGGYRAVYSIPLFNAHGEIIGTLATYFPEPHSPCDRDRHVVELYARQGGWAIENANLYQTVATARAEAEMAAIALAESEAQYRVVEESIPFGVWMCNPEGQNRYISQSFLDLLGMTLEESQQQGWLNRLAPEDVEPTLQQWQHCLKTGEVWNWEYQILGSDGNPYTILSQGRPVRNDKGAVVSWAGINLDITDRKQIEQERLQLLQDLATHQKLLEAVLQQMPAGVMVAEAQTGRILLMNEQIEQILSGTQRSFGPGKGRKDPSGKSALPHQISYPDGRPYSEKELPLMRAIKTGEVIINEEVLIRRPDGSTCAVFANAAPIRDPAGSIVAGVVTFYDISDRKRVEAERERLVQQERELRQQAEGTTVRLARLQYVTAALSEALTATEIAEAIVTSGLGALGATVGLVCLLTEEGNEFESIGIVGYPEEYRQEWQRFPITAQVPIADAVRDRKPIWLETPSEHETLYPDYSAITAANGKAALVALPMIWGDRVIGAIGLGFPGDRHFNEEDRAFMLALTDQCAQALERSRLFEAERAARAEAEAANRLKDEFLAVLSHELRTPLNPILGWAQLLQMREYDSATHNRALQTIERNAKLQAQLIEDLLDVSRILQGKLNLTVVDVDLGEIARQAIETVRLAAAAKSIVIHPELECSGVMVWGDANRLQQVLWNLLSNAVKFTPKSGQVTIRVDSHGNEARIQVTDTGIGIEPEFLPHVFERFRQGDSTTTRRFGGLGLGLAIVRHLLELHGGRIFATSEGLGLGCCFTAILPLAKWTPPGEIGSPAAETPLTLTQVNILVVDDEVDTLDVIRFTLENYGAQVQAVTSATAALEALRSSKPDILISDIGMPEMDGYGLISAVRSLSPDAGGDLPAIALTAYAAPTDRDRILEAGFGQQISKPIEPEELVRAIIRELRVNRNI